MEKENNSLGMNYPGLLSGLFRNITPEIKNFLEKKEIKITQESLFFFTILIVLVFNNYLPTIISWSILTISLLFLINLVIPNLPKIKKTLSTPSLEKILKKENPNRMIELDNYISKSKIGIRELKLIFKKFPDNYEVNEMIFKKIKLSEEQIIWLIQNNSINKEVLFKDKKIINLIIKSCRKNINYSTYEMIKKEFKKRDISGTIKFLNYKYINYTNAPMWIKNCINPREKVIRDLLFLGGLVVFILIISSSLEPIFPQSRINKDLISEWGAYILMGMFFLWILNLFLRVVFRNFFTPKE